MKDEQGNRNDIVLQDDITVMIVNKGATPLKIGVSTPVIEVAADEEIEDDAPAEDSIEDDEQEIQNEDQASGDSEEQE